MHRNNTSAKKDFIAEQITMDLFSNVASLYWDIRRAVREVLDTDYTEEELEETIEFFNRREIEESEDQKDQNQNEKRFVDPPLGKLDPDHS